MTLANAYYNMIRRLYQAYYGLMVCPWYAYSQTMISEVSPLPQMYVHQGTLAPSRVAR